MLQASEVEHSHTPIRATRNKNINAIGTESNVIDLLVVGNQLGLGREGGNVPDGASGINRGSNDQRRLDNIPVQRSYGCCMLGGL